MYNLLDITEAVIETNITVEAAALLLEHTNGDGFSYFYYPLEPETLEQLKQEDRPNPIRFLKPVSVN